MNIVNINFFTHMLKDEHGKIVAFGSIDLEHSGDLFRVRKIRVIRKKDGELLVCMPSMLERNGKREDIAHPLSKQLRHKIDTAVISVVKEQLKDGDPVPKAMP